jgi:DNA gyrase subunit B
LLLTFFYRQMPELIERGHIYIGQPPLYKLKRGKAEYYVKDDAELNSRLLSSAIENASLYPGGDSEPIEAQTLDNLAREFMQVRAIIERWGRRYDPEILNAMIWLPALKNDDLGNAESMRAWCQKLAERLGAKNGTRPGYQIEYHTGTKDTEATLQVSREYHGVTTTRRIHEGFFRSPEYQRITSIGNKFKDLLRAGAYVVRGNDRQDVSSVPEAIDWLMAKAKQGQTIQRYKGLGEMNPDQLWETTINPETRRLMQVRIEDAIAADEVFTTLMGDHVEPRRDFIERNALSVANLDV